MGRSLLAGTTGEGQLTPPLFLYHVSLCLSNRPAACRRILFARAYQIALQIREPLSSVSHTLPACSPA